MINHKRFRLFFTVIVVVIALSLVKAAIHYLQLEILTLNALFTSAIAAAVFLIGFLLSSVLSDYKEAERMPAEMRVSLEAIYDDSRIFSRSKPNFSVTSLQNNLLALVSCLQTSLEKTSDYDLRPVLQHIDALTDDFAEMEDLGMPPNYIVRLRSEQSILRKLVFRIYHIQRIQFVPSAHVLVQSLSAAIVLLLLFLKTEGSPESALIFGALSYMFIYALYLVNTLEQPFRKGTHSLDDVSLFLLRDFQKKLARNGNALSDPNH